MKQLVTKAKGYHIGKGQKITVQEIVPLIDEGNGIWKLMLVFFTVAKIQELNCNFHYPTPVSYTSSCKVVT